MTCPITLRLGVYALGAADAAERTLIEPHLTTCEACRVELARLEPLSGLLARVPVNLIGSDPPPASRHGRAPVARITQARNTRARNTRARNTRARNTRTRKARASAWRWRSAVGVAAAVAIGAAGGFWLAGTSQSGVSHPGVTQPAANSPPAAITMSGENPVTHVRVTVRLTGTSWGTSIRLLAWGLPINQPCLLIVRSRTGATEVAGAWNAWRAGPVSIPASAAWRPADISSLQVATTSRSLVTVTSPGRGLGSRG